MITLNFPGGYVVYDRHFSGFTAAIKQNLLTWETLEYKVVIPEGGR